MDDVYEFLIGRMNYDVVCIIKDKVEFLNHQEDFMFCLNQIINVKQEYDYQIWTWENRVVNYSKYMIYHMYRQPLSRFYKHILRNNRTKQELNRTKQSIAININ